MTDKSGHTVSKILVPVLYALLAVAVVILVCLSGQYPFGSETMTHIYRGDLFYNEIKDGNFFPLYDPMWYNGVEILRFCAPLPYYILAGCQFIAAGNPTTAYLIFIGLLVFFCALSWFVVGVRKERLVLGGVIGALWFFMPNNLYVLFFEGNLLRAFCMIILPLYINYLYDYMQEENPKYLLKILVCSACMSISDLDYVIMLGIATILFMVVYGILYHQWKISINVMVALVLSIMVTGVWTIPAIVTTFGTTKAEIMQNYFQNILKTLNPLERYSSANEFFYFGLAAFILALAGVMLSRRKSMPGFWMGLILLILTTSSMYPVVDILPGKDYLLMCQYISIALCMILCGFFKWTSLKKPIQVVMCLLLFIDVIPSLNLIYGTLNAAPVEERFEAQAEVSLIAEAKELTGQRIALMDESTLEAKGAYLISGYGDEKATSFGSEWRAAATAGNISQLNRALLDGFYPYLFDRAVELGNDTVLIKTSEINTYNSPIEYLDASAYAAGYELVDYNEEYRLYDLNVDGNWGTVTKYPAIGIGSGASYLSLCYPTIKEASSDNLSDYTYEELVQYELIYLAGFTYDDRESAEELIVRLSEAGVRVVILADGVPEDRVSHARDFLGIVCNDIAFSNGYPLLDTRIGVLDCDFFPQGLEEWSSVYVNGLDEVWGTVREGELNLSFYGTVKNDNIIVVGLNLVYFYIVTGDEGVAKLLSDITNFETVTIPERQIVPITVDYKDDVITITSEADNVNTSLAYHSMFESEQSIEEENNLLYVNSGTTVIKMKYPYYYLGIGVMLAGIIFSIVFVYVTKRR